MDPEQLIGAIENQQELLEEDGEDSSFEAAVRSLHSQFQEDEREEPGLQTEAIAAIKKLAAERGITLP